MKVNYGIYIGTTSASISKMEVGVPVIIRSNTLKDSIPMAVFVNRRGSIQVGDAAMNALKAEKLNALKNWDSGNDNAFIEFTRTLGSDAEYHSSYAKRSFTSEELLAEVLKTLISFEKDIDVEAAVITIPAAFKYNQIEAVRKAGYLAGLKQIEILQVPVAAAMAYGLNSKNKDGYWLVFDFREGTFDAALLKISGGIRQVIDTEGDNYLGGRNLDEAIVDDILIPYLKDKFQIDELLSDDYKRMALRSSMRFYAAEVKKQLSFSVEVDILTNLGDLPGEDDEGNELELDLTVTASELETALFPIFQKAIDICQELLERNNLKGSQLTSLVLSGSPTISPILRKMLSDHICKPDTSLDPETIIAKGAAIYASTIELSDELKSYKRDRTKIQLEVNFEPTSIFDEEDGVMKILVDQTEGKIPEKIFANVARQDGGWSSGYIEINTIGEIVTVHLEKNNLNTFDIHLVDEFGNRLECEPSSFNISQGGKGVSAVLPYNIGIEIQDKYTGKLEFRTIEGLSKSKQLPASGTLSNLKIPKEIRPGVESDIFELDIYQGEHGAEGTRAIYNHHVNTIRFTGNDLPALLPANSNIDIEVRIDINQRIVASVHIPCLDFTIECECESAIDASGEDKANYLNGEIVKGFELINQLKAKGVVDYELDKAEKELTEIKSQFEIDKLASDNQQQVLGKLRKVLKAIDEIETLNEWPQMEKELKEAFNNLEEINKKKGNEQTTKMVNDIKPNVEEAIRDKDKKHTPALIEMINTLEFELNNIKIKITKDKVEDLLFQLTEDGLIPANTFQEFYKQLSNINGDTTLLEKLYKDIIAYESK